MPVERSFNTRNIKRAALAAPVLLFAAHFGCSSTNKKEPPSSSQTSGQQVNPVTTPTPFTEQFGEGNQSPEPKTNTATRVPTFNTPSENPTPQTNKDSQNSVNIEQYVDKFGDLVNTVIRGNDTYTYKLIQNADPNLGIPNVRGLISDPKLYAYISDPEKRAQITSLYQQALDKNIANPNDPEIPQLILDASMVIKDVCTTGFHKTIMKFNASMIYFKDPKFWQDNQFAIIDSNCFWGEKTVTSQDHEIIKIPLPSANDAPYYEPDGYFIYKGVGYDELVENLAKLKPLYQPSTFPRLTQYIMDAKRLDAQNPNNKEIMQNLSEAGNIVMVYCERNKYSREYMRLLASLVYEKYPTTNDKYRLGFFELFIIDCEVYSKNL